MFSLFPCSAHHHRLLVFTLSQTHFTLFTFHLSSSDIGFTPLNTLSRVHPLYPYKNIKINISTTCPSKKVRSGQLSRSTTLARNKNWDSERVVELDVAIQPAATRSNGTGWDWGNSYYDRRDHGIREIRWTCDRRNPWDRGNR